MRKTFMIVNLLGFEIRADLSWLAMFGLILWSLAGSYFPAVHPALSVADNWTLALAVTTFLSVSIAAHEVGHSLVARRTGVVVRSITLFALGGVSEIDRNPDHARDEFSIAVAGPAVSFALALAFAVIGWAGPAAVGIKLAAFGSVLGMANLWLGLFNLIPGFPLDGGRVLHAVIWQRTGDARRATRYAGLAGRLVGMGVIALGTLQMAGSHWMDGLWMVFIGWYLYGAASQEANAESLREWLSDLTAGEVMLTDCPSVSPTMTLQQLEAQIARSSDRRCFPVIGGSRVTGLITLGDLHRVPANDRPRTTVGAVMTPISRLQAVHPETGAYEVVERMTRADLHELAVMETGEWRGVITLDGILQRWQHSPHSGLPG